MSPREDEFGAVIREGRARLGLSLRELGERSGLSSSTISRLERSEASPSLATVGLLAGVLGPITIRVGSPATDHAAPPRFGAGDERAFLQQRGLTALDELLTDDMIVEAKRRGEAGASHALVDLLRPGSDGGASEYTRHVDALLHSFIEPGVDSKWRAWATRLLQEASTSGPITGKGGSTGGLHNASSRLGELRTAGRLLSEGHRMLCTLDWRSADQKGCDALVRFQERHDDPARVALPTWRSGRTVGIEVHTMRMAGTEESELVRWLAESPKCNDHGIGVGIRFTELAGKPKSGESPTIQFFRKLAAIKRDSSQQEVGVPTVLWLDLMEQTWRGLRTRDAAIMNVSSFAPLNLSAISSSGIWHSCYGRARDLVPRDDVPGGHPSASRLPFAGRFESDQREQWAAVVLAFLDGCVLFENPNARHRLNSYEIRGFLALGCDPLVSRYETVGASLAAQIATDRARLVSCCG